MGAISIAVIGAGMAGLACARELSRADVRVTVFEKSRGLGGRLATRREGAAAFDHGAQYVTARSPAFQRYLDHASDVGALAPWRPDLLEDRRRWDQPIDDWRVGTPGMSSLVRPLARGLDVRTGVAIAELRAGPGGWQLRTDGGWGSSVFRAVAVAIPAPQALPLLAPLAPAFGRVAAAEMAPCWSVMAEFDDPLDAGAAVRRFGTGALTWAACDSSKPQRPPGHRWVLQAAPAWSRAHLESAATDVAEALWREFAASAGLGPRRPARLSAHRWRHALVERPLDQPYLADEERAVGTCGDWCLAPRVEAAYTSGRALAHALLTILGRPAPALFG